MAGINPLDLICIFISTRVTNARKLRGIIFDSNGDCYEWFKNLKRNERNEILEVVETELGIRNGNKNGTIPSC